VTIRRLAATNFPLAATNFPFAGKNFPLAGKNFPLAGKNFPLAGKNFPLAGKSMFRQTTSGASGRTGVRTITWCKMRSGPVFS
jgi:hypothetical protein